MQICPAVLRSQPPLCRLVRILAPNRVRSAVLPQRLAGIKGPSFLKGRQRTLCDHLLCPFYHCSSLKRQGAICPHTKERSLLSYHPNTRQKYLYISRLFLVCRLRLRMCASFRGMSATMANIFTCPVTPGNVKIYQTGDTKPLLRRLTVVFYFASERPVLSFYLGFAVALKVLSFCFAIVTLYHH